MKLLAFTFLVACGSTTTTQKPTPKPEPLPPGEDVTAQVVAMNSANLARPPTEFRPGNVTPIALPKAVRNGNGYEVAFTSHSPITTPAVYQKELVVSGGFSSRELYAFETGTGKPLWALDLGDDGPSSPACEDGVCVVSTESCTIFAVEAATGKLLWSKYLGDPLTSTPAVAGQRVFASYPMGGPMGANHVLAAFDLHGGKILWQLWLDGDVMSAPVAIGNYVYATTFAGTVVKVDQATGAVKYASRTKATSAPVVQLAKDGSEQLYFTRRADDEKAGAEEMIVRAGAWASERRKADYIDHAAQATSAYNSASAQHDAANGFGGGAPASAASGLAWGNVGVQSVSSMQGFQGSRLVHWGESNINTMGDEVIATDSETGAKKWSYKLTGDTRAQGGFLGTAPAAVGDGVVFGTLAGNVVRLDGKTGKEKTSYAVGAPIRSQVVTDAGWIYVGTEDGKLVAIDTHDPAVTGWSTWGGNAQRTGLAR
jgi:outer membrane protein assembly factor BamB